MTATLDDLLTELKTMNQRLKLMATMQLLNPLAMPRSRYWTWYQKSVDQSQILAPGQQINLITEKELPSDYGYFHSLDMQMSSGSIFLDNTYSSYGRNFDQSGHVIDYWLAGFNPRNPSSAGDPVVIMTTLDQPTNSPTVPEWTARISPSFNVPFNTPFQFSAKNDTGANPVALYGAAAPVTLYGYNLYFLMLTSDGIALLDEAENSGLIFGQNPALGTSAPGDSNAPGSKNQYQRKR